MSPLSSTPNLPETETKAVRVRQMFNRIAPTYDLLNDCISLGMHRQWKQKACHLLNLKPGDKVLDVCTGTGDLVPLLLKTVGVSGRVTGVDFSEEMLTVARQRHAALGQAVEFIQADALSLPFADNTFDGAIVSFGLRNVANIDQAISEMARVVKPGKQVINLDTCPQPRLPGYWFYFSKVMPWIGSLLSSDQSAYKYLSESTREFLGSDALVQRFTQAGLSQVRSQSLAFGTVNLQQGQKI